MEATEFRRVSLGPWRHRHQIDTKTRRVWKEYPYEMVPSGKVHLVAGIGGGATN